MNRNISIKIRITRITKLPVHPKTFSYALSNTDRLIDWCRKRKIISTADPSDLTPTSLHSLRMSVTCN